MTPLPDQVSVLLRSSPTAAIAALLLISTSHRGLLDWFSRTVEPERQKPNGAARKPNGHRKPRNGVGDRYLSRRREARDRDDDALVEAMRRNTEATIGDLATAVGKSRTSIVSALHRLRNVDLAESSGGKWKLVEKLAPREPPAKWIAPLSATAGRVHASA